MEVTEVIKNAGGRRLKAGRKPIADKKVTVPIYPRMSRIALLGIDEIKDIAHESIEKEYYKKKKII